jgi:hypothetical protein
MTAEEMNDWYYSARCTGCGCLWFHEPHKAGCPTKAQLDILNTQIDYIEGHIDVPWNSGQFW